MRIRASSSGESMPLCRKASLSVRRASATVMPCMEPKSSGENKPPLRCLGRKERGLMLGHQRINDLVERFALDDLRQFVEREVDAVIAHAPLRKIVGADALGAIARTDNFPQG